MMRRPLLYSMKSFINVVDVFKGIDMMRLLRTICMSVTIFLVGCALNNGPAKFAEGVKNFQVQNYRQAFIRLMPFARAGKPEAQYAIGYMYYYGQGVTENRTKAWYWITSAAKAGSPDAKTAIYILRKTNLPKKYKSSTEVPQSQ
jgi:TPR repeat protein